MANIKTFVAHPGSNFTDNSITVNAQQNNIQSGEKPDAQKPDTSTTTPENTKSGIRLNRSATKVDLYRVILALQKLGFFTDGTGCAATQKAVFHAFGTMLGENFDGYQKNLSEAAKHNNDSNASTAIFDELSAVFAEYEANLYNSKERK